MKQSSELTVGFAPIARTTFDMALADQVTAEVRAQLMASGFRLIEPESLITDLDRARAAGTAIGDDPPDLLLILQATFADSTMVLELVRAIDAPFVLWAVPEEHTGGRLRLNSLCGINLAGHALTRAGYRYEYIYASPDEPAALEKVDTLARAGRARRLLRQSRLGCVGQHPAGFETCHYDASALKQLLGLEVVPVELGQVFGAVKQTQAAAIETVSQNLAQTLTNLHELDQAAVHGTLGTYLTLRELVDKEQLDGLAVRCWPEFFTELGCAACGAMSMLSDQQTPCSCEADVNGTITQLILQWLSGEPAFGSDLVSVDVEDDVAVLWHCGLAPMSMADPEVAPRGTVHSNRQLPLLMEFPLKPGRITVARLSAATGQYRLVVGTGEMLRAPSSFSGTSGVLRFDRPAGEVLDTILSEGLEHHFSITYGDHAPALLTLARILDLPILRL